MTAQQAGSPTCQINVDEIVTNAGITACDVSSPLVLLALTWPGKSHKVSVTSRNLGITKADIIGKYGVVAVVEFGGDSTEDVFEASFDVSDNLIRMRTRETWWPVFRVMG